MISAPLEFGSQAAIGSFAALPRIAAIPAEWLEVGIQVLPGIALFLFGLIVGTFFFRRRRSETELSEAPAEEAPPAETETIPNPAADEVARLESELAESRQRCESGAREVERLNSDLLVVKEEVTQARARMEEWKAEAMALSNRARQEAESDTDRREEVGRLTEEIQGMRFAAAARDGEIARLKSQLARRESALEQAEAEVESVRAESDSMATRGPANPIASRVGGAEPVMAGIPNERIGGRRFIRRLLGISHPGTETRPLSESGEPDGVALSPTSLAEARAALDELKRSSETLPRVEPGAVTLPIAGAADGASDSDEVAALHRRLEAQETRIAELESELERARRSDGEGAPELEGPDLLVPGSSERGEGEEGAGPVRSDESVSRVIGCGNDIPVTAEEMVLFRGVDPRHWNTRKASTGEAGGAELARPVEECPETIDFIRLCRLDTGESVVSPITREELLRGGSAKASRGWSGRGEEYFGASHLGFFAEGLPREVETKFGFGGWGFGHREGIGSGQAFGWAGLAIEDPGEGFSISVGRLPEGATIREIGPATEAPAVAPRPETVSAETVAAALAATTDSPPVETSFREEVSAVVPDTEPTSDEETGVPTTARELTALTRQADRRTGGLVLFRGNDPALWNTDTFLGSNRRSRSLETLPEGLSFLRLRRLDTGEGVVVGITNDSLTDDADGQPRGFNGTNELFYGAHHLGIFDESLPQDVETRFTYGGWGFGHSVTGSESQASGWEGKRIDGDTVFEIAVFRRMPILGVNDRMLD